jgi:Pyridoxamine 5'-phosphate oxidase
MPANITTDRVWRELEERSFALLGYVTPRGEAPSTGIVYVVRDRQLYITTGRSSWKARHIAFNPDVSLTVAIPKRIPFVPWIQIPAATITFVGDALGLRFRGGRQQSMNAQARGRGLPSNQVMSSLSFESSAFASAVWQNSNESLIAATSLSLLSSPFNSSTLGSGTAPTLAQK